MTESTTIRWEQDETGVVTLVLDDPNQSANTMNQAFMDSIAAVADRAEAEKDSIRGIIYTSAKKTFFAGGDLKDMIKAGPENAQAAFDTGTAIKRSLRRIETLGKPVVAAINGAALGGVTRSPSPPTTASPSTRPAPGSACPRSPSACCPRAEASPAPYGSWASPTRC